ncbi:transcriptional regulator BetI [Sphingobium aromaticiconvertens]|uniref:transcriptional regulator BetI n=1 Tax=Sphingobium aromaticiconvertens TaxID=365341 RepID=UPI0030188D1A
MKGRFVRESPDVRRQALIDATALCLAERGAAGTSVRAICSRAGVSSGLLTHYFDGVDALILATYRDVCTRVAHALEQGVAQAGDDPRTRLRAYILANFRAPILDADLLATWIAFWSLVKSNPAMSAAHAEMYGAGRARMEGLLQAAAPAMPAAQVRLAAIGLTALVDGLWLELCLDPSNFSASEADRILTDWIDTLVGHGE